jgi:UDP-glucose 4-epimerase
MLPLPAAVEVWQTDYSKDSLSKLLAGFDLVIHLAGNRFKDEDYELLEDNLKVLNSVLYAMVNNGVPRFVFTSSRMVYTPFPQMPSVESEELEPVDFYGLSKVLCESMIKYYASSHGLKTLIFRVAQVIGWGERINNFHMGSIHKALLNQVPLKVFGDGMSKSNYIYVKDVCRAIRIAIESDFTCGVYNLGGRRSYTNLEYANCVSKTLTGTESVEMEPMIKSTNRNYEMDCSKIQGELGWVPEFDLREALEDMSRSKP